MSHRKISKGARAYLLSLFPPDGYVVVTILDQTIGFLCADGCATTRHPEALIHRTEAEAIAARDMERKAWEASLRERVANPAEPEEMRKTWQEVLDERPFDHDPWVEPVQVEAYFRARRDTW